MLGRRGVMDAELRRSGMKTPRPIARLRGLLPSMITSSFGYAWAAKRYRSLWMCVIVHGVEGYFIVLVLAVILGWYP